MIKNMTKGRIHKTSLFIQPEFKCNVGCKGCYAVKAEDTTKDLSRSLIRLKGSVEKDMVEFNQVTVSLNDLEEGEAVWSYQTCKTLTNSIDKKRLHYACAINSIATYADVIDFNKCSVLNISLDYDKISKLRTLESEYEAIETILNIKKEYPDLHINANILIEEDTKKNAGVIGQARLIADSIHLIMKKPIDNLFNEESLDEFQDSFEGYIKHALAIKETYGSKIDIDIDSCVKTVLSNLIDNTTFTCRAGVDHVSLWPDGKMTGCAYRMPDTLYNGKADSKIEFADYDKLEDVKVSEFNMCLYNKLATRYGSFEGLCDCLGSVGKATDLIKNLI